MCDTILAPPGSTTEHIMLFGKNSDRQRNEAQTVEQFPCADYAAGVELRCTYITIPQTRHTHAVLLCRPFWMWGAEMGANEHGVVIGNEGLQARSPDPRDNALIGMDLLRLALERAGVFEIALKFRGDAYRTRPKPELRRPTFPAILLGLRSPFGQRCPSRRRKSTHLGIACRFWFASEKSIGVVIGLPEPVATGSRFVSFGGTRRCLAVAVGIPGPLDPRGG